jgi:hypothetical protein
MRSVSPWFLATLLLGCSAGTGGTESVTPSPTALAPPTATARLNDGTRVLGQLETRDEKATLLMSADGLRVTVHDGRGTLIAEDVKLDELRQKDPFLYEVCRSSVASNHYLDARLDVPSGRRSDERFP